MLGDKVAIIVSTGRTATKAIAHYFDTCYENVCARHEPFPSHHLRFASNLYLTGRISRSSLRSLLISSRKLSIARLRVPGSKVRPLPDLAIGVLPPGSRRIGRIKDYQTADEAYEAHFNE